MGDKELASDALGVVLAQARAYNAITVIAQAKLLSPQTRLTSLESIQTCIDRCLDSVEEELEDQEVRRENSGL